MRILVTGGAGYIGSHFVKALLSTRQDSEQKKYEVVVFDNLSRGHREAVPEGVPFVQGDLLDPQSLSETFASYAIDAVVHFAALAYVGESVSQPDLYYRNNVVGSFNLITAAQKAGVRYFVFSSTCSLYGNPERIPISESERVAPINPYAKTKLAIEYMLQDFADAYEFYPAMLRYFNAAGASSDGSIGESHVPEAHLIPLVLEAALGKRESISVFGEDYPTPDGTCIRDYIHVEDLAAAHLAALEYLVKQKKLLKLNLGTGTGYSVKEIIDTAERVTGKTVSKKIIARRAGDPAILVADNTKARETIGWQPAHTLETIIKHACQWHKNPRY